VWSLVNTCHSEHFRGEFARKGAIQHHVPSSTSSSTSITKRCTNVLFATTTAVNHGRSHDFALPGLVPATDL